MAIRCFIGDHLSSGSHGDRLLGEDEHQLADPIFRKSPAVLDHRNRAPGAAGVSPVRSGE